MNEKELKEYEEKVKKYKSALNYVYTDGTVTGAERTSLENLKNELGLTADECRNFEQPYVLAKKAQDDEKQLHFADIFDKGINEDRYLESKWDELENVPFITDENGKEILDAEEIWKYFNVNHSKGIAYLVNDYPAEKYTERLERFVGSDFIDPVKMSAVNLLGLDNAKKFFNYDVPQKLKDAFYQIDAGKLLGENTEQLRRTTELEAKNLLNKESQIHEWLYDTSFKADKFEYDMNNIKNDAANIAAVEFILKLSEQDLSSYKDASSLSKFIIEQMKDEKHALVVASPESDELEPISSFGRELYYNNALQEEVKDFAASISELEQNKNVGLLNEAKQLIEDFAFNTSMSTPAFEDLKNIGLLKEQWEDPYTHQKYDVDVTANLIDTSITTTINDRILFREEHENLQDMIAFSLSDLQADDFINIHKDNPIIKDLRKDLTYDIQKEAQKILDESFSEDAEANISNSALYIPSDYGFEKDNKLHILLEVNSDEREDALFNALAEKGFTLPDGTEVDFNPITFKEHGSIEEYLEHLQYMNENERWKQKAEQTAGPVKKSPDEVIKLFTDKLKDDVRKYDPDTPVSCVLNSAKSVLKTFSEEDKKIIGKWLMDSGADSPNALQKKLENEIKPKRIEQKREITRHRDDPLRIR